MQPFFPDSYTRHRADIDACRTLLRDGSRTFYVASFLLPRHIREPASALYAFCRLADDAVDVEGGSLGAVARLRERLERAYAGQPDANAVDRAFAETIERFQIPRAVPEGLIDGLEWDARGRRYETIDDVTAYAVRVAGTVGVMMAMLMGVRSPDLVARACDLGIAMQLTNIARDVGEDARAGRLYLPAAWMSDAGIDANAWLTNPRFSNDLGAVIARLLDTADAFYRRSDAAIAALPLSCRPGIRAARLLYADIGNEVRRRGYDSVSQRAVVSANRKAELLTAVLPILMVKREIPSRDRLHEAAFLLDAVSAAPAAAVIARPQWWDLPGRYVRVIDIFEQIEKRELSSANTRSRKSALAC